MNQDNSCQCKICGATTLMTSTRLCNACWQGTRGLEHFAKLIRHTDQAGTVAKAIIDMLASRPAASVPTKLYIAVIPWDHNDAIVEVCSTRAEAEQVIEERAEDNKANAKVIEHVVA